MKENVFYPMAKYSKIYHVDIYPYLIGLYVLLAILSIFKSIILFAIFAILAYPVIKLIFKWKKVLLKNVAQWKVEGFSSITIISSEKLLLLGGYTIKFDDIEKIYVAKAAEPELSGWYKYFSKIFFYNGQIIFTLKNGDEKVLPIQDRAVSYKLVNALVDAGFTIYMDLKAYYKNDK